MYEQLSDLLRIVHIKAAWKVVDSRPIYWLLPRSRRISYFPLSLSLSLFLPFLFPIRPGHRVVSLANPPPVSPPRGSPLAQPRPQPHKELFIGQVSSLVTYVATMRATPLCGTAAEHRTRKYINSRTRLRVEFAYSRETKYIRVEMLVILLFIYSTSRRHLPPFVSPPLSIEKKKRNEIFEANLFGRNYIGKWLLPSRTTC